MNTYTATDSTGRVFTRTSQRTFTHAAIVSFPWVDSEGNQQTHTKTSFAGSLDGAHRAAKQNIHARYADVTTVEIVEVTR